MVNLGGVGKVGDNDQNAMYKILKELIKVLSKQSIHKIGSSMSRILNASSFSCAEPILLEMDHSLFYVHKHTYTPHIPKAARQTMG